MIARSDDPFVTYREWHSDADERAYRHLAKDDDA
jgi:hypothetical protein